MIKEIVESFDSSYLIPKKEEVKEIIRKLENNEKIDLEDELIIAKVMLILDMQKRRLKDEERI